MPDYEDPKIETQWFAERREEIAEYLLREGVTYGQIAEEPAWFVAPYVSIWAIGSAENPDEVEWWAISGDLPNDYVSAQKANNPREAMHAIASLWLEAAQYMSRGEQHPILESAPVRMMGSWLPYSNHGPKHCLIGLVTPRYGRKMSSNPAVQRTVCQLRCHR